MAGFVWQWLKRYVVSIIYASTLNTSIALARNYVIFDHVIKTQTLPRPLAKEDLLVRNVGPANQIQAKAIKLQSHMTTELLIGIQVIRNKPIFEFTLSEQTL